MLLIVIALAFLGLAVVQAQPYTKCSDLPEVAIDYAVAEANSPLHVFRSTQPNYECATGFLTGPAPTDGQNYTFIIIQNDVVRNSFRVYPGNTDNTTLLTMCDEDTNLQYRFLPYVINSTVCYFVTYICDSNDGLLLVRAYGHSDEDAILIDQTIAEYNLKNIPGGANIMDTQTGCKLSEFCENFFL